MSITIYILSLELFLEFLTTLLLQPATVIQLTLCLTLTNQPYIKVVFQPLPSYHWRLSMLEKINPTEFIMSPNWLMTRSLLRTLHNRLITGDQPTNEETIDLAIGCLEPNQRFINEDLFSGFSLYPD